MMSDNANIIEAHQEKIDYFKKLKTVIIPELELALKKTKEKLKECENDILEQRYAASIVLRLSRKRRKKRTPDEEKKYQKHLKIQQEKMVFNK